MVRETLYIGNSIPDSKVHGANMGPTWVPGGPHVGLVNLAKWDIARMKPAVYMIY